MKTIIVYESKTGFTERYARWAAEELGCECILLKNASKDKLAGYDRVIFGGWIMANMISGLPKLREMGVVPAVVFAVGASPAFEEVLTQIREQNQLGETPFFYFEGGVDFNKLGFVQRMMLKMMKKAIAGKENKTEEEKEMEKKFAGSFDHAERASIEPLVTAAKQNDSKCSE